MAYKKIEIANCNYCPSCKGKKGIFFHKKLQVKYHAVWGKELKEFKPEKLANTSDITTTACCADCLRYYTII